MSDALSDRLTTHGVPAWGATLCEVRHGKVVVGHVRKLGWSRTWDYQPSGWHGWTEAGRMRDAVEAIRAALEQVDEVRPSEPVKSTTDTQENNDG